jgi:hypothetical protein
VIALVGFRWSTFQRFVARYTRVAAQGNPQGLQYCVNAKRQGARSKRVNECGECRNYERDGEIQMFSR